MKILNLDDIALESGRTIAWNGVTYKVKDFNVSEFLKFQKLFSGFQKAYVSEVEGDMDSVVRLAAEIAQLGIEGFPEDGVQRMNPVQMLAVVSMIANLLPEPDAETSAGVAESEKKEELPATTEG